MKMIFQILVLSCLLFSTRIAFEGCFSPPIHVISCPRSAYDWVQHARIMCPNENTYHCLITESFSIEFPIECCMSVQKISKGHMPIYNLNKNQLQEIECEPDYFMPATFQSNRYRDNGVEHCKYKKDKCQFLGMKICTNGSTKDDRSCYCDYTNHYVPAYPLHSPCFYAKDNACEQTSMCNAFHYKLKFLYHKNNHCLQNTPKSKETSKTEQSDVTSSTVLNQTDSDSSEGKCHCATESRCTQKDENIAGFITKQSEETSTTLRDVSDQMDIEISGDNNTLNVERLLLICSLSLCAIQFSVISYCIILRTQVKKMNTMRVESHHGNESIGYSVGTGNHYDEIDIELERNSNITTHNIQVRNNPIQIELMRELPALTSTVVLERSIRGTIAEAFGNNTVVSDNDSSSSEGNGGSNCESGYLNPYQPLQTNDSRTTEPPYTETTNADETAMKIL